MAVDLYTLFFSPPSSTPLPPIFNPLKRSSDLNLDESITDQLIGKRRRNDSIISCEKIRRKRMRQLFSTLRSLLPLSTTSRVARYCIIEETGKHIQNLQNEVHELKKKKAKLLLGARESISLNVSVQVYGSETVIIRITASRMPRSLSKIYEEIEGHGLEIESADVYRGTSVVFLYFHVTVIVSNDCQTRPQPTLLYNTLLNIY
ncbi:hypothetical protein KI387_044050 [Taxus chinensis]|uniref:BHLH domain-containing protein n=1 Tax=Taxus chinensis TaxID=29808 RepID=A0AA38L6G9_TAXCH|nr:hypothetical protein KI387_044050 [Taxus chinensis]